MTRLALAAFASSVLGACAALPDDASVVEKLEPETGVTITRLGHPIELYRETFLKDPAGRIAFLGPFETNQMGQREQFLWIACGRTRIGSCRLIIVMAAGELE